MSQIAQDHPEAIAEAFTKTESSLTDISSTCNRPGAPASRADSLDTPCASLSFNLRQMLEFMVHSTSGKYEESSMWKERYGEEEKDWMHILWRSTSPSLRATPSMTHLMSDPDGGSCHPDTLIAYQVAFRAMRELGCLSALVLAR